MKSKDLRRLIMAELINDPMLDFRGNGDQFWNTYAEARRYTLRTWGGVFAELEAELADIRGPE